MFQRRRPMWLAAAALTAVAALPPAAPAATVRTATLDVPDLPGRVVEVSFDSEPDGARRGAIDLLVRNRAVGSRVLRVRYAALATRAPRFVVHATGRSPRGLTGASLTDPGGLVVPVSGGDVAELHVTFLSPFRRATPEQADGRLIIVPERVAPRRIAGAPLVLRLRGIRAEERLVTPTPASVSLPVVLGRPSAALPPRSRREVGEASVELRGPGAAAFAQRNTEIQTVLRREDGTSVKVGVKVQGGGDDIASLALPEGDAQFDKPGRYVGTLFLGPGADAPKVLLVVNVRMWLGWAILAVLLGVVLGRMVPQMLKLARLRQGVRETVGLAVGRYGRARRGHAVPASYDLDWLITPLRWRARGLFSHPQDRPAAILRELEDATTPRQLRSRLTEAKALLARVDRWSQVERSARPLADLLDAPPGGRAGNKAFRATVAHVDARAVLEPMQDEPADLKLTGPALKELAQLCRRADRETDVLRRSVDVWQRLARLDDRWTGAGAPPWAPFELDTLWDGADHPMQRRAKGFGELRSRLDGAVEDLKGFERRYPPPRLQHDGLPGPLVWMAARGSWLVRGSLRRIGSTVSGFAEGVVRIVVAQLRTLATRVRRWLVVAEGVSTLLGLAVPVLAYVLTLYDDTWGSPVDFFTAFAAGFLGKIAIDFTAAGFAARAINAAGNAAAADRSGRHDRPNGKPGAPAAAGPPVPQP